MQLEYISGVKGIVRFPRPFVMACLGQATGPKKFGQKDISCNAKRLEVDFPVMVCRDGLENIISFSFADAKPGDGMQFRVGHEGPVVDLRLREGGWEFRSSPGGHPKGVRQLAMARVLGGVD